MEHLPTDVLIIGFGKGGKTLAGYLGKQGVETILIEQSEKMYGGTCINIGCIPTKTLVTQAQRQVAYTPAIATKDELTSLLRQKNYDSLHNLASVRVITGKATFLSPHEVAVTSHSDEDLLIKPKRIIINTGTIPSLPAIAGIEKSQRVYTSTTLLDEKNLPEKLVIIGGGFIALEYASIYAQYGSAVTILDRSPVFLAQEDEDIALEIKSILEKKGIEIISNARVTHIDAGSEKDQVIFNSHGTLHTREADAILFATGRIASTDGLGLEAAGVITSDKGFIQVNGHLQTSQPHIWAIGDINGGPQFTYISLDDYRIIRNQFSGLEDRTTTDRKNIPFCVFITPPFAHIGLREKEAIALGMAIKTAKIAASVVPRTRILGQTAGVLKAIVHKDTDQILGFTLVCAEAHELINTVRFAMNSGLTFSQVMNEIYTHPSMTEAFNYFDS